MANRPVAHSSKISSSRINLWRIAIIIVFSFAIFMPLIAGHAQTKTKGRAPAKTATAPVKSTPPELQKMEFVTAEVDANGKVVNRHNAEKESFIEDLGNGVKLEMVKIPGGSFSMGSTKEQAEQFKQEIERYCEKCKNGISEANASHELPQHKVNIKDFYMAKFEITQAQWKAFIKLNPSNFKDNNLPVENVSWNDCVRFCKLLSQKTGIAFRLPTEAEWEYACRAGSNSHFSFGDTVAPDVVNYDSTLPFGKAPEDKYRETTLPGGKLGVANAFGLYDMHGNVYEWCEDIWHEDYTDAPTDGSAWMTGGDKTKRVLRGGAWDVNAYNCRSAYRLADFPDKRGIGPSLGFRIVATLPDKTDK